MTVCFAAVFSHNFEPELLPGLPQLLNAEWKLVVKECDALMTYLGRSWRQHPWRWSTPEAQQGSVLELSGPYEFEALVTRRWIRLRHPTPWPELTRDPVIENALTEIVRLIAVNVGSRAALYLPSGWSGHVSEAARPGLHERDLEGILELLLREWGPPAAHVRGIYCSETDAWVAGGYCVEAYVAAGAL
jgi:hypothetical protein